MPTLRDRIESRLRERLNAEIEADLAGRKGPKPDLGPLFERLDDVIAVVEQMRDYSVEPYHERVRQIVCSSCRTDETGFCATRDNELCGLDKYFPTIVASIEKELKAEHGH